MAGRKITYKMHPLTFSEYLVQFGVEKSLNSTILEKILTNNEGVTTKLFNQQNILERVLVYGLYPNTLELQEDRLYLENLVDTVIFKDIIELGLIEHRAKALELLKVLAYQIGNLISYTKIASKIGLSAVTVQRYI